jgi:hypothetical protein
MLTEGNLVRVVGKISDFDASNPQISGLVYNIRDTKNEFQMTKLSEGNEIVYTEISPDLFLNATEKVVIGEEETEMRVAHLMLGTAVSMKNLTFKSAKTSENSDALTLYCEVDGKEVQLHMPAIYDAYNQPITAEYFNGKTFDVKGIVDVFYETYQIEFYSIDDITFH